MDKTRVLHVIGKRPRGGIGTFLINMHTHIDKEVIQFDYLINANEEKGNFDYKAEENGGKVYLLPELSYKNTFKYLNELYKFYKENHKSYKIVHIHSVNIAVFNFILCILFGIKHRIAHAHSTKYSDKLFNSFRNFFLQLPIMTLSTDYFACGRDAGIFLFGKRNYDKGKITIIKNAIDIEKYKFNETIRNEVRKELKIQDEILIGQIGAFLPVKNHKFTVEIFKELLNQDSNYKLVFIGSGELEYDIRIESKNLGIYDNIIFMGNRNDVYRIMQGLDLIVMPSLFEGIPLVAIEAQAMGIPLLISDKVSEEVILTETIKLLSLSHKELWIKQILEISHKRSEELNRNKLMEYDIIKSSKILQGKYLEYEN